MNSSYTITKTAYSKYFECPSLMKSYINKELIEDTSIAKEYRSYIGQIIGEIARNRYDGILVNSIDILSNLLETKKLISSGKILFEAGFCYENLYARTDVIIPNLDELGNVVSYNIVEVKQGSNLQEKYLRDIAFQKYVIEKSGIKVDKTKLLLINNEYVRHNEIDYKQLFIEIDVCEKISDYYSEIDRVILNIKDILSKQEHIDFDPNICKLKEECLVHKDEITKKEIDIFELRKAGKSAIELYNNGVRKIKDIPTNYELSKVQEIQKNCYLNNSVHIDKIRILDFLKEIKYPIYFLDFEAGMSPIPFFDNSFPNEKIPFQYSIHKVQSEGSDLEHYSFISLENKDRRLELLKSLIKHLGNNGTIIVYFAPMERSIVKGLCRKFLDYSSFYDNFNQRLLDLHEIFDKFYYYNKIQKGSTSIKNILPIFSNLSYKGMYVNNGDDALAIYGYIVNTSKFNKDEIVKIEQDLIKYCELDTYSMYLILNKIKELTNN